MFLSINLASSCPDEIEACDWSIYNDPRPNPHLLVGALVAGPDINGYHEDSRTNYSMNRVAIDYNAGFQSALAGERLLTLFLCQYTQISCRYPV